MPNLVPNLTASDLRLRKVLVECRTEIRNIFAELFNYEVEDISWKPDLMSFNEFSESENVPRFELYVIVGHRNFVNGDAILFKNKIIERCPQLMAELGESGFNVWLTSYSSTDYS